MFEYLVIFCLVSYIIFSYLNKQNKFDNKKEAICLCLSYTVVASVIIGYMYAAIRGISLVIHNGVSNKVWPESVFIICGMIFMLAATIFVIGIIIVSFIVAYSHIEDVIEARKKARKLSKKV